MWSPSLILDIKNILGRRRTAQHSIVINTFGDMYGIRKLSCNGTIKISYTNTLGVPMVDTYNDLVNASISFNNYPGKVYIDGDVTLFEDEWFLAIDGIDVSRCEGLKSLTISTQQVHSLDVSRNLELTHLQCNALEEITLGVLPNLINLLIPNCPLTDIDLSGLENLGLLNIIGTGLTELDISNNTHLTTLYCNNVAALSTIRCIANNNSVATAIAQLIQQNSGLGGTVYCNSTDAYYSVIETAANTYGWTIEQL